MNTTQETKDAIKACNEASFRHHLDSRPQCPVCEHSVRVIHWRTYKHYKCNECGTVFKVHS